MLINHKPKVYIAVPTYSGKPWWKNSVSILHTVLGIQSIGWECAVDYIARDCMIHSVRNKFVGRFMRSDCTHLFFIDDDISFDPKGLIDMVKADKEVISGFVPIRQGETFTGTKGSERDGDLIQLHDTGAAFLCIKRQAIQKMIDKLPDTKCMAYGDYGYSLFDFLHNNGTLYGEDIVFCKRWSLIGKIWGFPGIKFEHLGDQVFEGCYLPKDKPVGLRIKQCA